VPVRSARGIRQLEVLDPHHEDDIVPVILEDQIITGPSP